MRVRVEVLRRDNNNGGVRQPLSSFQRLALWTTATTYLLILVGGLVRASGAGLGCPDWPRCFGSWVPPASAAVLPPQFDPSQFNSTLMWTEYLNRLLGVGVGLLVLATAVSAWRRHRREPHIVWTSVAALLLTGFQGWLGGRVVAHELAAWLVTAHMLVALVIVSLLLYATMFALYRLPAVAQAAAGKPTTDHPPSPGLRRASRPPTTEPPSSPSGLFAWAVAALMGVTLIQVVLGTQVRGRVDEALDRAVTRANAVASAAPLDVWHRDLALAVLSGALLLVLLAWSRAASDRATRWCYLVVGLAAAQVALGAVMAYVSLAPVAQIGHLTIASLLLGAQTVLLLVSRWEPGERQPV